jgi:hypothetical protein
MAEHLRQAVQFIEQVRKTKRHRRQVEIILLYFFFQKGHVRVGPETITDPAFLVSRTLEDFVTWTERSKIRRKVQAYNDKLDDFDLL